jgi:ABC-2 type transport system permease protein
MMPQFNAYNRLTALMTKESLQIVRDPSTILICVVLPFFLLFLYGYGVSLDLNHLRLGLLMEDNSPEARSFAYSLYNSSYFEVKTAEEARPLIYDLEKGSIRGFVVVPSYFTAFRHRPNTIAPIQVIADGSEPNTANFVQNYVRGAFDSWLQQEAVSEKLKGLPKVEASTRFWYNERLESRNFLLPGSLGIIMTLIGTLLTALVVSREWERGTMEALISTPIFKWELIVGKLIPYFFLGMLSMALCFVVTVFGFHVPFRGSIWLLALVAAVFLFCALGLGFMISTLARNQVVSYQISIVIGFLPAYILSGFLFEIYSMPLLIQLISYMLPARYFVQSLQTLFLAGNVWRLIFFDTVPMLLMGMAFFLIAIHKTKKWLD